MWCEVGSLPQGCKTWGRAERSQMWRAVWPHACRFEGTAREGIVHFLARAHPVPSVTVQKKTQKWSFLQNQYRQTSEGHMTGFVLAAGQPGTLVEPCLMFRAGLGGGQGVRAVHVLVEREWGGEVESDPYSSENVNKVLNDTEEGITMSTVLQCDEIPLWTKTPSVAQWRLCGHVCASVCVHVPVGFDLLSEREELILYISFH